MNKRMILIFIFGFILLAVLYSVVAEDLSEFVSYVVNAATHPLSFSGLLVLLPMIGFPILPFLVLLGVKFGAKMGIFLFLSALIVHLMVSYVLTNSVMRSHITEYASKHNIRLPEISQKKMIWFSFLFMITPGLSYTMKNYLLPISGIPLLYHIGIGFFAQGSLGIPFIIAGRAASGESFLILAAALVFIGAASCFGLWMKRKR